MNKMSTPSLFSFETNRLFIRQTTKEDLDDFIALYGDPHVMKHYADGHTRDASRIEKMIQINVRRYEEKIPFSSMTILEKESNAFVGNTFISTIDRNDNTGLLGYLSHQRFWNQGYAKEAIYGLIHVFLPSITHTLSIPPLSEVIAYCKPESVAPDRILTYCGFRRGEKVEKFGAERFKYSYEPFSENT